MIYFKADANASIGAGHLHRALALAKECNAKGVESCFIFSETPESLIKLVRDSGFQIYQIESNRQLDADAYLDFISPNSLIVFDTDDYRYYSGTFIDILHKHKIKTACYTISDSNEIKTDLLLNPNIISQIHKYQTAAYTKLLLGPKYMIFRKEFREKIKPGRPFKLPPNLLLIFGNADVKHLSIYFLQVIERVLRNLNKVRIVVGELNPDLKEIERLAEKIKEVELHINTINMQLFYEDTDLAITTAGMAMWEMALYKIPQMVVASSPREIEYTDYLSESGFIYNLSPYIDRYSIEEMANYLMGKISSEKLKAIKTEEFYNIIDPNGISHTMDAFLTLLKINRNHQ